MVLTSPHFLFADSRYRNGVIGMNPIVEKHRIFLDLEPVRNYNKKNKMVHLVTNIIVGYTWQNKMNKTQDNDIGQIQLKCYQNGRHSAFCNAMSANATLHWISVLTIHIHMSICDTFGNADTHIHTEGVTGNAN